MPSTSVKLVHIVLLGLLAAIIGGTWYVIDRQRPIDEQALDELESTMLTTSLDLQGQLTTDIDMRQLAEEKARAESEEGLRLSALCTVWIDFDRDHHSETTRANRDRACNEYRRFVETGELPEATPD
jgi:hypothetical protein